MNPDAPQPIAISSSNCTAMTGLSWKWVVRFARKHDVPSWHAGRRRLISGAALASALARAASSAAPPTQADRIAQLKDEITQELLRLS